jgi:HEAT repeat protein
MFPTSPRFKASVRSVATLCFATINFKVICILFATAVLFACQVKAQEKSDNIDGLIRQLQSQDEIVRRSAARALGKIGPEAVPRLIVMLKHQEAFVRRSAADALGQIGPEAKEAVPALIVALKDQEAEVHRYAAALRQIEPEAKEAVPTLIVMLKDQETEVRTFAANALGRIGPEAKEAVPALIVALKDQEAVVRTFAIYALGEIRPEAKEAVPALIVALKDQEAEVRRSAASALGNIPKAKEAVPALIVTLKDQEAVVRTFAVYALGEIGPEAKEAVPALIVALKDQEAVVRRNAASALEKIGPEAKEAVPALIVALRDQDSGVRGNSALALGEIGPEAKEAVPALTAALKDQDQEGVVRGNSASALGDIAAALFDTRSTESLAQLKAAYDELNAYPDTKDTEYTLSVKRTIDYFESLWWVQARARIVELISDHPYISITVAAYLFLQVIWLLCFWLLPLSLLKIITSLSRTGEKFKIPKADIPIPLKTALVFPLFHYHPRLLDAWVRHHLDISKGNFDKKQTVAQRKIYVAMPALMDGQMRESLSAASVQPIFDKKKVTVLIAGEGGAGKTSMACQMAMWAMTDKPEQRLCKTHKMLPVLLEGNLPPVPENKDALVEAIRGGLRELIGESEPIFEELLLQLLRKRRVLVIVDSLSELDETTRKSVRPAHADFPVAAQVVTSRIDEDLGGASKTLLRPLRLHSNRLSEFMDGYLKQLGKRSLFDDPEYFAACGRLSEIVGDREITLLIAKMYAEQMIAVKEAPASPQGAGRELPGNLPDLMLGYVKRLNDQVKADQQDIRKLINVAKVVAWECLKQSCRPTTAKRDEALKALSNEAGAEICLKYLEERLQLIRSTGPISDLIRFSLDPLAEYLAALSLVERCGRFEDLWREFFERAREQQGAPETIKGFLLAVRDCCAEKGDEYGVPGGVRDELGRLAGLDPEAIDTVQLKQRINRLIANLKLPDAEDRATAARAMGQIGSRARDAVPALVAALKDQHGDVRSSAAAALGNIGPEAEEVAPALYPLLEDGDPSVRSTAAAALGMIGLEAKELVPALLSSLKDQDARVRSSAAAALGNIGPEAEEVAPALLSLLEDQDARVRSSAIDTLSQVELMIDEVVPRFMAALNDQSARVRISAIRALGKAELLTDGVVSALVTAIKDQDRFVRLSAVSALGHIRPEAVERSGQTGPEAKGAVSALIEALNDPDAEVRSLAAKALGPQRH